MNASADDPLFLDLVEAIERLADPEFPEDCSPLTGAGLLVVRLDGGATDVSPERLSATRTGLLRLPCPSIALETGPPSPAAAALAERFDLRVDAESAVETLARSVAEAPRAAMSLVQLLRHSEHLDVEGGLMAESWVYSTLQGGPEFQAWLEAQPPGKAAPPNTEPAVLLHREGDTVHMRLNRPEKHNAFSAEMRDALCEGLGLVLRDETIREVVLSGEGRSFSSGGDLDEFGTHPDPATAHAIRSTRNAARLLAACGSRVVAHVHGACVGAGTELPAFASHVVARAGTWFQLPEVRMGLVPGAGGTVSVPRRIGRQRTAWLAITGERLELERALAWGLVDEVR